MGFKIEGPSGFTADTTSRNRIKVDAITEQREVIVSVDDQRAFNVFCTGAVADGEYVAYLKNTSTTRNLFIQLIRVGGDGTAPIIWKVHKVTGTAADGTTATAVNLNLTSGIQPEATILQDGGGTAISGLTSEGVIAYARHDDAASFDIPFAGALVLGPQNAIAVESDDGTMSIAECLIRFYYEDL